MSAKLLICAVQSDLMPLLLPLRGPLMLTITPIHCVAIYDRREQEAVL